MWRNNRNDSDSSRIIHNVEISLEMYTVFILCKYNVSVEMAESILPVECEIPECYCKKKRILLNTIEIVELKKLIKNLKNKCGQIQKKTKHLFVN